MKMFDGVSENLSQVKIGQVSGQDLSDLIIENVINNLKSRTRNVIIQWSDIQVNRTMIKDITKHGADGNLYDAIKIKNPKTRKFEKIKPDKIYTIALPEKYLQKESSSIKIPALIKDKFKDTGETYDSLFRKYLHMIDYKVKITDKTREKRIL